MAVCVCGIVVQLWHGVRGRAYACRAAGVVYRVARELRALLVGMTGDDCVHVLGAGCWVLGVGAGAGAHMYVCCGCVTLIIVVIVCAGVIIGVRWSRGR